MEKTALIDASRGRFKSTVVNILLDHRGININEQDDNGSTALMEACDYRVDERFSEQMMLSSYAKHNLLDKTYQIFHVLLSSHFIDVNLQNNFGETALILLGTCTDNNIREKAIKMLMSREDIDLTLRTVDGNNFLSYMKLTDTSLCEEIMQICIEKIDKNDFIEHFDLIKANKFESALMLKLLTLENKQLKKEVEDLKEFIGYHPDYGLYRENVKSNQWNK